MNVKEPTIENPQTKPVSAYEKQGVAELDPRCIPTNLTERPPVGSEIKAPEYSAEENEIWKFLYERQTAFLPGRASKEFLAGMEVLGLTADGIPKLADLSRALHNATGWKVARIPGLLHERDFFQLLSERIFPSTDYIRGREELDYTPAPDCFHDIFGHMPMLANPDFADFYQRFGMAALHAEGIDRVYLERLHWFTVEFGLIEEPEGRRIFGAGVLSSREEVVHALSEEVTVLPFDPDRIIEQDYEVWHLQDILFTHQSFPELERGFAEWTKSRNLA